MDKIEIIEVETSNQTVKQIVKIDRGNDEFTWVDKSIYDEQQAEQSTPILTGDE